MYTMAKDGTGLFLNAVVRAVGERLYLRWYVYRWLQCFCTCDDCKRNRDIGIHVGIRRLPSWCVVVVCVMKQRCMYMFCRGLN